MRFHWQHSWTTMLFFPACLSHWQLLHRFHHRTRTVPLSKPATSTEKIYNRWGLFFRLIIKFSGKSTPFYHPKQYRVQPRRIWFPLLESYSPLASVSTYRVFPLGFDFMFETMEVRSHSQFAWTMYVIVKTVIRKVQKLNP